MASPVATLSRSAVLSTYRNLLRATFIAFKGKQNAIL